MNVIDCSNSTLALGGGVSVFLTCCPDSSIDCVVYSKIYGCILWCLTSEFNLSVSKVFRAFGNVRHAL